MSEQTKPEDLMDFPCHYQFKAIGEGGEVFCRAVVEAIRIHAPVPAEAVRSQSSRQGTYQSVSVVLTIYSPKQLTSIYAELNKIAGLKMLL
jgi:putative lipoic acid-binding regulatory protein